MSNFDFGFTAMDEDELDAVQRSAEEAIEASASAAEVEDRINDLYNMIMPLLNNLAANPEKEYIYWPNRLTKIEEFRDRIDKVYKG